MQSMNARLYMHAREEVGNAWVPMKIMGVSATIVGRTSASSLTSAHLIALSEVMYDPFSSPFTLTLTNAFLKETACRDCSF